MATKEPTASPPAPTATVVSEVRRGALAATEYIAKADTVRTGPRTPTAASSTTAGVMTVRTPTGRRRRNGRALHATRTATNRITFQAAPVGGPSCPMVTAAMEPAP